MNKELSFEEKLDNLEKIVKELEQGDVPLDNAIEKFNEAMKLSSELNKKLNEATETINKVINNDGSSEDFKINEWLICHT